MQKVKKICSVLLIAIIMITTAAPACVEASTIYGGNIFIGKKVQLSVNTKKKVTWISSDKSVATVTQKGLVTGKGYGGVFIFAKYGDTIETWLFSVISDEEEVVYQYDVSLPRGITISQKTLYIGNSCTLELNGVEGSAKWESSDKKVATVSSKGIVTAVKKGTTKITATVGKKKYTCTITVIDKKLHANVSKLDMEVNGKKYITITINPDVDDSLSLAIDNEDIIYTELGEQNGDNFQCMIKALSKGTAKLTFTTLNSKEKLVIPITVK